VNAASCSIVARRLRLQRKPFVQCQRIAGVARAVIEQCLFGGGVAATRKYRQCSQSIGHARRIVILAGGEFAGLALVEQFE
jgi:hypothetical protein